MARIDPTARVSEGAVLAEDVSIGPYAVVGDSVTIGEGTSVGPFCMIEGPTTIGRSCTFTGYASIGSPPQDHSYRGEDTRLRIGDHNTFREFVTVNRGTVKDRGVTAIGDHNLIMAYCHVAHDCIVGSHVVMGNLATLAGHVEIQDNAIIGGLAAIHQFTRVGAYVIVGGGSMVSLDIVPYAKASGDRATLYGVNTIGLKRSGFSKEQIARIEKAYRILFKQGLLLKEAISVLEQEFGDAPEVGRLLEFLRTSRRGIAR
ncbi:MAG TPA: acyl-ACP--UDP-N-acetylglucosamine O-acyltransferase [Deltaproteobacteria bacterium]|nr:acyl-ACP--UDP-N-acetylglucosamine O-acyltransferase [Deltaproteobacteria bacterium]HXK47308.1 acyl-ACP--UDP-N-acetylglucosamine O-acyltransferase [Deltaproteobacteria bacterium]